MKIRKRILLVVTTYPLPSSSYDELVCTAGITEDGEWIRIYPMPLSFLNKLKVDGKVEKTKYTWIELDLIKRTDDFRPESHSPADYNFNDLCILDRIASKIFWVERRKYCLKNVYTNMKQLIEDSKAPRNKSLAVFKPTRIKDFIIESTEREWKSEWKAQLQQSQLNFDKPGEPLAKKLIPKVPYNFSYKFIEDSGVERTLQIQDWEIGQLYWNCLRLNNHNEVLACADVKKKYFDAFTKEHDIYLFLGTTKEWHQRRGSNPFVIVGVFYPKKNPDTQLSLF